MSRMIVHRASFAMPHDCAGQLWTEAIAVLNVASAELRLEAAEMAREASPGNQYSPTGRDGPADRFRDLLDRANRLDELADWLRDGPTLS